MEERFVPPVASEARPIAAGGSDGPLADQNVALDDPRALQILTTEHWSLLTARSLVYNEAFARAGMFLAFLSATLLVLGLISTATGFSDGFLAIAAVLLGLDAFIGLATLGRINGAGDEDIRYLQGMNRLRNAYHAMVPGHEGYFITSKYDDFDSTLGTYGPQGVDVSASSTMKGILHGFTTAPVMIAVIVCAVIGALAAVLLLLVTHDGLIAVVGGGVAFFLSLAIGTMLTLRAIVAFGRSLVVKFPAPGRERTPDR